MKVEIDDIRLSVAALSNRVHAGVPDKDGKSFKHKKDLHDDFITCVIQWGANYRQKFKSIDGRVFEITVKELPRE